jgi:hypothetical protein
LSSPKSFSTLMYLPISRRMMTTAHMAVIHQEVSNVALSALNGRAGGGDE